MTREWGEIGSCTQGAHSPPFVACGWYTPDYRDWWDQLRPTLERHGASHDFVEVPKCEGGWEVNTMAKPREVAKALRRHPDKVVLFIDVDCQVQGSLDALASIRGWDVAFYVRTKFRRNGGMLGSARDPARWSSGPTYKAREFAASWVAAKRAEGLPWGGCRSDPACHCHRPHARRLHRAPGRRPLLRDSGDKVPNPISSCTTAPPALRAQTEAIDPILASGLPWAHGPISPFASLKSQGGLVEFVASIHQRVQCASFNAISYQVHRCYQLASAEIADCR